MLALGQSLHKHMVNIDHLCSNFTGIYSSDFITGLSNIQALEIWRSLPDAVEISSCPKKCFWVLIAHVRRNFDILSS